MYKKCFSNANLVDSLLVSIFYEHFGWNKACAVTQFPSRFARLARLMRSWGPGKTRSHLAQVGSWQTWLARFSYECNYRNENNIWGGISPIVNQPGSYEQALVTIDHHQCIMVNVMIFEPWINWFKACCILYVEILHAKRIVSCWWKNTSFEHNFVKPLFPNARTIWICLIYVYKNPCQNTKFFKKKYELNDSQGTTSQLYLHTQEIELNTGNS